MRNIQTSARMATSGGLEKVAGASTVDSDSCAQCPARAEGVCGTGTLLVAGALRACRSSKVMFAAGDDIVSQGEANDTVYSLVDGWAICYMLTEDGQRQILDFCMPGATLGLDSGRPNYGVQALTEVTVCAFPRNIFEALTETYPSVAMHVARQAIRDRGLAYDRMASIGRHSARERVARLLLELFVRARVRWPGHHVGAMHLPLTQEHIGDATGLSGVHVNRVLRSLREMGIVNFRYHRLHVIDPDELVMAAGTDMETVRLWTRPAHSAAPLTPSVARPRAPSSRHRPIHQGVKDESHDAFFHHLLGPQAGHGAESAAASYGVA